MSEEQLNDWQLVKKEPGPELPLFRAEFRHMQNPRNRQILKAIVLNAPDTINVIALTKEMELILVEQFRFGIDRKLTELPAGLIDGDESPLEAAKRELLEETGYIADSWTLIGRSYINPAYVTNSCYHFLALDAIHIGETLPDEFEDLKVHLYPLSKVGDLVESDILKDAIGCAAISCLQRFLQR